MDNIAICLYHFLIYFHVFSRLTTNSYFLVNWYLLLKMSGSCNNPSFPVELKDEICFKDEPLEDSVDTVFNNSSTYSTLQGHSLKTEDFVWVSACTRI